MTWQMNMCMSFFAPASQGARVCLFLSQALKHRASQDPDNWDVEQLGLIRLCGMCLDWHIPIIGITPMHLLKGMSKKRHTRALYEVHNLEGMM
jgi:hypothetical protein